MAHNEKNPKWTQLPEKGATCCMCGKPIDKDEEYEVVKRGNFTRYLHTFCIKKEAQNNG